MYGRHIAMFSLVVPAFYKESGREVKVAAES